MLKIIERYEHFEKQGHPNKWLMLSAMCLAIFCAGFTATAIMNALPIIQQQMHISAVALQWVVSAYSLTAAALIIVGGLLGDIHLRRLLFYIGSIIFICASVLIALCGSTWLLILGRAIQGIGAALITPTSLAIVMLSFPKQQTKMSMSIWAGCLSLGFALGPLGSGLLTQFSSWRMLFWLGIVILLAANLILLFTPTYKPLTENRKPFSLDILGIILLILGITSIIIGLVEGNDWGWTNIKTLSLLSISLVFFITFYWVERHKTDPLIDIQIFKSRLFVACLLSVTITVFCLNSILYFFNIYSQNPLLLNDSTLNAGLALLPVNILIFVLSFITPKLLRILSVKKLCSIAFGIMAIGFFYLHLVNIHTQHSFLWLPLSLVGLGLGLTFTVFPGVGMNALAGKNNGLTSGIINATMYLATALGIAIGTITFMATGQHTLQQKILMMKSLNTSTKNHLIQAFHNSQSSVQHISAQFPNLHDKINLIAQQASLNSFKNVMLLDMTMAIIGALIVILFIKNTA